MLLRKAAAEDDAHTKAHLSHKVAIWM